MPRTLLVMAVALGGCHTTFGLELVGDLPHDAALLEQVSDAGCMPNGHDEDGDGIDDNCDLCPQLAVEVSDPDGDNIGTACDPDPTSPDVRLAFLGFNDDEPPLSHRVDGGGSWSRANGQLTMTTTQQGGDYLAQYALSERDVTVETQFTVFGTPLQVGNSYGVGVWADIADPSPDPTFPIGIVFEIAATFDVATEVHFSHIVDTTDNTNIASPDDPALFAYDQPFRVRLTCAATSPACLGTVSYGAEFKSISLPVATTRMGAVGLRVHGASARFDYLAVYGRPQ